MKGFALSMVLLTGLFMFTKCGSAEAGEKTADKFFSAVIKKDFQKAEKMMDRPFGDTTDFIQQIQWMENNPTNGQLLGFKKSIGFNTQMKNGVTTVELPYTLNYDNGDQAVTVIIQNRGGGYKIVSVR